MDIKDIKTQFDSIAGQYDEGRRCFIPCFDDYYIRSVSLLKHLMPSAETIVDLGAGTGLLTKEIFLLYPEASFMLADLSEEMLSVAKQRFSGLKNFSYRISDYSQGITEQPDIICSALSIHHLDDHDKQQLYDSVFSSLRPGGIFINLDQFRAGSDIVDKSWNDWWLNYIDHSGITEEAKEKWIIRRKLDRETTIPNTLSMLRRSGFVNVDCIYQFMKFATIIAVKSQLQK